MLLKDESEKNIAVCNFIEYTGNVDTFSESIKMRLVCK